MIPARAYGREPKICEPRMRGDDPDPIGATVTVAA